jgi:hypothetical protein
LDIFKFYCTGRPTCVCSRMSVRIHAVHMCISYQAYNPHASYKIRRCDLNSARPKCKCGDPDSVCFPVTATALQLSVTGPALLLLGCGETTKSWENPTGLRSATNAFYVNRYAYSSLFIFMHIFHPTTTALPSCLRFLLMFLVNISYFASVLEFCCYSVRMESTSRIVMDTCAMLQWLLKATSSYEAVERQARHLWVNSYVEVVAPFFPWSCLPRNCQINGVHI